MIVTILACFIFLVLSIVPSYMVYCQAHRERKLEEARLKITQAATRLEDYLKNEQVPSKGLIHNDLFPFIFSSQFESDFDLVWERFEPLTPRERARVDRIVRELESVDAEILNIIEEFVDGYYRAFRFSKPWQFPVWWFWNTMVQVILKWKPIHEAKQEVRENVSKFVFPRVYIQPPGRPPQSQELPLAA
jgi:hypothetical protein